METSTTHCDCAFALRAATMFETMRTSIEHGHYLLTVSERLTNGNILTHRYHYVSGQHVTVCAIGRRAASRTQYCSGRAQQEVCALFREPIRETVDCGFMN